MYKCKNFKEYIKVQRKYCKKYWRLHKFTWNEWLSYKIFTEDQISECFKHKKYCHDNLPIILNELREYQGQKVWWVNCGVYGILRGVELTNMDYYWIFEIDGGKIRYESCCGGFLKTKDNAEDKE